MTYQKSNTLSIDAVAVPQARAIDQIGMPRTRAQDKALLRALRRGEPYHLFPMPLRGDAGALVCKALARRRLATDEPAPILTALGIQEARAVQAKEHDPASAQVKGG